MVVLGEAHDGDLPPLWGIEESLSLWEFEEIMHILEHTVC